MSNAQRVQNSRPLEDVFARYHVGWKTRNPDLIAASHTEDTIFLLHDGTKPVVGREALRQHCIQMFAKYQFGQDERRTLFGDDHWVFEWIMVLELKDKQGHPFTARVEMLDVVDVDAAGLVTRKEVYMNGAQSAAAFQRAGINIERGIEY
jgi:hypothetical protein